MSKGILTADIHLSPLPRDEYRWGLFPWLVKQAEKHKPDYIAILGDLTQFKDEHQGSFVNRVVDAITTLTEHVGEVVFIPGNHDGIEASKPFFRFLERMTKITVAWKPQPVTGFVNVFALPHTRNYEQDWESVLSKRGNCIYDYPVVLCHQTFDGSISENGTKLEGIPPSVFKRFKGRVYSGDIHVPQKVGKNGPEYVGAPYRVRFGDTFEPRCLLIGYNSKGNYNQTDLHFNTVNKHLLELDADDPLKQFDKLLDRNNVYEKDQVKVRVVLRRSDYTDWPKIKAEIVERSAQAGIELFGPELKAAKDRPPKAASKRSASQGRLSPQGRLIAYASKAAVAGDLLKAGQGYLSGNNGKALK